MVQTFGATGTAWSVEVECASANPQVLRLFPRNNFAGAGDTTREACIYGTAPTLPRHVHPRLYSTALQLIQESRRSYAMQPSTGASNLHGWDPRLFTEPGRFCTRTGTH